MLSKAEELIARAIADTASEILLGDTTFVVTEPLGQGYTAVVEVHKESTGRKDGQRTVTITIDKALVYNDYEIKDIPDFDRYDVQRMAEEMITEDEDIENALRDGTRKK